MIALGDRRLPGSLGVPPRGELVHERLRDVLDGREPARHVAVERGVPHRVLALVAGGEHQRAELVRERHQQVAADARLQVLLGDVLLHAGELLGQRAPVGVEHVRRSARCRSARPSRPAQSIGVLDALRRRVGGKASPAVARRPVRARRLRASRPSPSRSRRTSRSRRRGSRSCARSPPGRAPALGRPPRGPSGHGRIAARARSTSSLRLRDPGHRRTRGPPRTSEPGPLSGRRARPPSSRRRTRARPDHRPR